MLIRHLSLAGRHLLLWTLITLAIVLSVVRIFLSNVSHYKAELEQHIRQSTGLPLHIGKLATHIRGFSPGIVLRELSLDLPASQQPPLALREVRISINLLQLALTQNPIASSKISLVGLETEIVRTTDNRILIKGVPSSDATPDWLLQGNHYEILQSRIGWQDQKLQQPRIEFEQFNLVLKNHFLDGSHELHCMSRLPPQYGDQLRLSAKMTGNPFHPDSLEGDVYLEASNLQGPALADGKLPFQLHLDSGSGDLKIWSQWQQGQPYHIDGYVQAQQIRILNTHAKTLKLDTLDGNLSWSRQDNGQWRLNGYNIGVFANHQRWQDAEFALGQNSQGDWTAFIKQFDLNAVAYLSPWFIDNQSSEANWSQLRLNGNLHDFSIFASQDWQHYAVQGDFVQLGTSDQPWFPGFQGLSGHVNGTESQGQIELNSQDSQINASHFFRDVLHIPRLTGQLNWWQDAQQWRLRSQALHLDSADFNTVTDFELLFPKNTESPTLRLLSHFDHFADISHIKHYLPAKVMDSGALAWLDDAFVAGRINQGEMVIAGKLDQFPFTNGQGIFDTLLTIEAGEIQFNEDWPHLQDLYSTVHFLNRDLRVAIYSGRSEQVKIRQATIDIENVAASDHVQVFGQLHSQANNALLYLQKTPLHSRIDHLQRIASSEGATDIDLNLHIPYVETDPVKVKVDAHLHDARMLLTSIHMPIENINGTLTFTEDSIRSTPLSAKTLGYPIQGIMSSDSNSSRLLINGTTSVNQLQRQFSFLRDDSLKGNLAYQADLQIPDDEQQSTRLIIDSTLQGVSLNSDSLIGKSADQARALHINIQFADQNLLPINLQYGEALQSALLYDKQQERLHSAHLVIGGNPANLMPQPGLKIEIKQPSFKLAEAIAALSHSDSRWPPLREVLLVTPQLLWQGHDLGSVECHFQHKNQAWVGTLDSAMAKGRLTIPDQRNGNEAIQLNMDSLNLSAMDQLSGDSTDEAINILPLIEINSEQLLWRSVNLGKLRLQTERKLNGIHFKKIRITGDGTSIDLSADWTKQLKGGTSTQIKGIVGMDNFGNFLSRVGLSDDIKETRADIHFDGGWNGGPHQFALEQLNGVLQVRLKEGRISSIEPGFGRLLGLLAMEQWVKRLSLNFSDIYRQGLAFDQINGNFKIIDGVATTDDLLVNAVSAKMKLIGNADLVNKNLNLRVGVIPKSSDALPIAGTIVGGIAAIVTDALTQDYEEGYFFGSAYSITGHWGDLEVVPVHDHDGLFKKTWNGLTDFNWLQ